MDQENAPEASPYAEIQPINLPGNSLGIRIPDEPSTPYTLGDITNTAAYKRLLLKTRSNIGNVASATDDEIGSAIVYESNLVLAHDLQGPAVPRWLHGISQRIDTLAGTVNTLAGTVNTLAGTVDALTTRVDALTETRDALTEMRNALTETRDTLTAKMNALTAKMNALTEKVDVITGTVDNTQNHVAYIHSIADNTNRVSYNRRAGVGSVYLPLKKWKSGNGGDLALALNNPMHLVTVIVPEEAANIGDIPTVNCSHPHALSGPEILKLIIFYNDDLDINVHDNLDVRRNKVAVFFTNSNFQE